MLSDLSISEHIHLPSTLATSVMLRNSHIRQDLSLSAPLCFPVIRLGPFRVTNVSNGVIVLDFACGRLLARDCLVCVREGGVRN